MKLNRLRRLFNKSRAEHELDKELRFHLEQQVAANLEAGMSPQEARRRARLEFGGLDRVKEEVRDVRWETHIGDLIRDFRYALRNLGKDRRFALVSIFALTLGIGASTIVFSFVYNVLFHALSYKDFNRSVVFKMQNLGNVGGWKDRAYFFPEEVRAFREQNHVLEDIIAYEGERVPYNDGKTTRYWPFGAVVTGNAFDYLGVQPLGGRGIKTEDENPGAPPVFVMSYRFWQREFSGDPKILGQTFVLNDIPTTLIGIMPPHFNAFNASYWLPVSSDKNGNDLRGGAAVMGRCKTGVSVRAAAADLDAIAHRLRMANPDGTTPRQFSIVSETLLHSLIGDFEKNPLRSPRSSSAVAPDRV
jgi:putative ABC transport system permease protein